MPIVSQLSLITEPRVLMRYDPDRQPPEATGPLDFGLFVASLAGHPRLEGQGRAESEAIRALAARLREFAVEYESAKGLTAVGQALTAAELLDDDAFAEYLAERAGEPRLA